MSQAGAGVEVFVFKGKRFLGSRCFSSDAIVIGCSARATLKLKDPAVSDRHAIVRVEGGKVVVADNDSQTGVFVNGTRVNTRTINSFDEIAIGPFRMKVSLLGHHAEEDPGFGSDHDEAATQVRRVETPHPAQRADAELQRAMARLGPDGDRGQYRERSAYEEESATHADSPRARAIATAAPEGFEDFDRAATKRSAKAEAIARTRDARPTDRYPDAPDPHDPGPYGADPAAAGWPEVEEEQDESFTDAPGPKPALEHEDPEGDATVAAEDDDDEVESWVEPFSLLENIVRERFKAPADTVPHAVIEVIRYKDGQILDLMRADPGKSIRLDPDDFRLVHVHDDCRAQLFFKRGFSGTVVSGGKARSLKRLRSDKYLVYPRKKIFGVELAEGDYAQLIREEGGYLVRFVRPPTTPKAQGFGFSVNWSTVQVFAGSTAFHLLILVMLGFVAPEADLRVVSDAERFAQVSIKDLKLEKPPEEKPEEAPKEEPPTKTEQPKPVKQPRPVKRRAPAPPDPRQQAQVQRKQASQVLSALQNLKPSAAESGRSDLKALASNIAAVRVPGGTASDFRVSGVIRKIPGGGVRLAGGFGGGSGTKAGSQLLRGGKIGGLVAAAGTGTRVRGRVRKAPTRAISATGGHLSREAIQKVVSQHMHQVQACYERQLITNPGLTGKIVFDWVITPSGSVGMARQVSSSMANPAVSTCIIQLIRSWRFPQPVGGSVQVRYPFVFRVSGF